ncbi:hypothetical protein [Caldimonas manganoxidans]|uniref:hypothetical protein n=1 Tax=Caldimonas manganoxidans TaxID=196015 RepID=UPI0003791CCC
MTVIIAAHHQGDKTDYCQAQDLISVSIDTNDVGLQDGFPWLLGGDASEVHHGIHAAQQVDHPGFVLQRHWMQFFAWAGCTQLGDIADSQNVAVGFQARAQFTTQAASRASEQQTGDA